MKKLLIILAALLILSAAALADTPAAGFDALHKLMGDRENPMEQTAFDLSALSFDELAALSAQCQAEMMTRDEWQEVTVPQGNYRVGVDIPAGKWVVRCADTGRNDYLLKETWISWGTGKPENGFVTQPRKGDVEIYNPKSTRYGGEVTQYVIELEKGDWVAIHPQYNAAVFTPNTGNTGQGFK